MGKVEKTTTTLEKVHKAAKCYYENKGYNVIDMDFKTKYSKLGLVAMTPDESVIVFVKVLVEKDIDKGMPKAKRPSSAERQLLEKKAADYLIDHNYVDVAIRFDEFATLIIDEKKGRAMVRCHVN